MLGKARKLLVAVLIAATLGLIMLVGTGKPASASATWCAQFGAKSVLGHSIATGQYCFTVSGSGTTVNYTSGSVNTGWIGYPTEVVQFYDNTGSNYASYTTFRGQGTLYGYHYWKTGIHGNARIGSVCGSLLSYGQTIARVCANIK
jgi:hypothetical protein